MDAAKRDTDVTGLKPKKGPKFEGIDLEMDVMKKIAHQLERLPNDGTAHLRVVEFVRNAVAERRIAAISNAVTHGPEAGQLGLLG
jgi:hypothetical protein